MGAERTGEQEGDHLDKGGGRLASPRSTAGKQSSRDPARPVRRPHRFLWAAAHPAHTPRPPSPPRAAAPAPGRLRHRLGPGSGHRGGSRAPAAGARGCLRGEGPRAEQSCGGRGGLAGRASERASERASRGPRGARAGRRLPSYTGAIGAGVSAAHGNGAGNAARELGPLSLSGNLPS